MALANSTTRFLALHPLLTCKVLALIPYKMVGLIFQQTLIMVSRWTRMLSPTTRKRRFNSKIVSNLRSIRMQMTLGTFLPQSSLNQSSSTNERGDLVRGLRVQKRRKFRLAPTYSSKAKLWRLAVKNGLVLKKP